VWGGLWAVVGCAGMLAAGLAGREVPLSERSLMPARETGKVRYDRDVRPLLSDRCFKCHGPDAAARKGDLRLDRFEDATDASRDVRAIVPGDPGASELWVRIASDDPEEQMPPPKSGKHALSAEERQLLWKWIEQGAVYERHWSFMPPEKPVVPEVRDQAWSRNDVDRFVLSRLEAAGIAPSSEATPEILARRVFMDVTGLPPTPSELDEYLTDARPDRYERLVDRLMNEEPYVTRMAERLATPWMDAARYADTCGIHTDNGRQMWAWRDWVLKAFKQNMPFDQFAVEQLAGDLLPGSTQDQKIASGFNRNHVTTDEGGAIPEEYLVEYAVDRAATTSSVFLGLTMGCARCHDHKYDPITQEDFYRFLAFFNSVDEPGLYTQTPDSNRAYEPFMEVLSDEQRATLAALERSRNAVKQEMEGAAPEEDAAFAAYQAGIAGKVGAVWSPTFVESVHSEGGATMNVLEDGSVLASGANPASEVQEFVLRSENAGPAGMLLVEALADPSLPRGRVGRAANGNAVLTGVEVESFEPGKPEITPHHASWMWADRSQKDGDYRFTNLLTPRKGLDRGWAVDGHRAGGDRRLMVLFDQPIAAGRQVKVRLRYESVHAQHVFGRLRLTLGSIRDVSALPMEMSNFWLVGPFPSGGESPYKVEIGPEHETLIDFAKNFGAGNQFWRFDANLKDGALVPLADGNNVTFVGRIFTTPTPREIEVSLSSDDGFVLYVNGQEAARREIERGLMPDQDRATLKLKAGVNVVVLKIINTGGGSGYFFRVIGSEEEPFRHELAASLLPERARAGEFADSVKRAWRVLHSPGYRDRAARVTDLEKQIAGIHAGAPKTMVMKELDAPRETFVLTRGQYDKPDKTRKVERGVPREIGSLAEGSPRDRLGLAQWMMSESNPLTSRVIVNRMWEMMFGAGLVRTSEDFGLQGEWPTNPELLDWLASEFRASGWNMRHVLKLMLTSSTYRQSSAPRPELRERDPDDRLLGRYPRRRQSAEQIRDMALYVSGLMVEKFGGPSVKIYQPDGLWKEGALPASNTQTYERGKGEDLYRRSVYVYWKRAVPPPNLAAFDAPTREFCVVRRATTGTPLQALVLWNDPQFVEAARALAVRTLREAGDDATRLDVMYRRCTGRKAGQTELAILKRTLDGYRERYRSNAEDAAKLLDVGDMKAPGDLDKAEVASWAMTASVVMNLYDTTTQE